MDVAEHLLTRLSELAPDAGRLLVAVSGGADSVALLRGVALAGREVAVAHLDHGLRPQSADDARFVEALAQELELEYFCERVDVASVATERGWNLEEAGRRVRYQFLARSAKAAWADAVITGHTLDDQAETVLMQLLRGAAFLRGMPARSRQVVRPLLDISHESLIDYLRRLDQPWREDPSNVDQKFLRAWLRHEIVPLLGSRFPRVTDRLGRHARIQQRAAEFVRDAALRLEHGNGYDQVALFRAHPAVQHEAIRSLIDEAGLAPDSRVIELMARNLGRKEPFRVSLAPDLTLRLAYGRLELARRAESQEPIAVTSPTQLPDGVSPAVLELPGLLLRSREPGDRMRLAGGSKSLARAMIDRKIPREERDGMPVLAVGNRILWAEGIGAAADVEASSPAGSDEDLAFMQRALELAREAAAKGELPVGAVVARDGAVVGDGHNETESRGDPTAHAEVLAMRRAAEKLRDWRLTGCTLYVTLEPCPMCAGATLISHLGRVVFGASNKRDGALGTITDIAKAPWKRRLEVRGGVLEAEAGELLSRFFAERRS